MRISDWSSDVCSSDLCKAAALDKRPAVRPDIRAPEQRQCPSGLTLAASPAVQVDDVPLRLHVGTVIADNDYVLARHLEFPAKRSEEHTSELQSLMRISYAVFCLKKKKKHTKSKKKLKNKQHTRRYQQQQNRESVHKDS